MEHQPQALATNFQYSDGQKKLLRDLRTAGTWGEFAQCKLDPNFTLDMDGMKRERRKEITEHCRSVCNSCPVIMNCLHHALTFPELIGFWGGRTIYERTALRNRMKSDKDWRGRNR